MSVDFRHIQVLSVALRNQIAAGEVVERPASALKELVENSIDAGASQIDVELENGGQALIRVQDDGIGIPSDELALAVTRHATSKISVPSDLEAIHTLGFRGEALPSIAQVAKFRLMSAYQGAASKLTINYGENEGIVPCALPKGTLVEVEDLFGNIPARLKFLKTAATETKHAQDILAKLALANLKIGFSFKVGGREVFRLSQNQDLAVRLGFFWPPSVMQSLRPFHFERNGITLHGLTSIPQVTQLKGNRILLFVNRRAVTDKRILGAIREAYKGKITSRDYPQIILFLEIDPSEVDVNVHPAKSEVRFQNESLIFSSCVVAIKSCLNGLTQVPSPISDGQDEPNPADNSSLHNPDSPKSTDDGIDDTPLEPSGSNGEGETRSGFEGSDGSALATDLSLGVDDDLRDPEDSDLSDTDPNPLISDIPDGGFDQANDLLPDKGCQNQDIPIPTDSRPSFTFNNLTYLGQIAATYLLFRDGTGALIVIDQHAAHERILYARFLSESMQGVGQTLMIPFELSLHFTEQMRFQDLRHSLEKMGFDLLLQGNSLVCRAIPTLVSMAEAKNFLRECLSGLLDDYDAMLKSMACRGAIKAGQILTVDEVMSLLKQWMATPEHEFCPHGRPAVLRYEASDFEKAFKRKQ
ncbi:MAG: DNA mismatch repair endonuclease MutL [Desulfovibrionaceae bacterium]|nr:DNA mismatch repair endonuclease MutL [Desulfovibrionaceae bacterium]